MHRPTNRCPGPLTRRNFLKFGSLAFAGLGSAAALPYRLKASQNPTTDPDTSVILVWLPGGPPHMETYDMKPDAPEEYRGAFRPIKTNVPGIEVCEHLPLHAKVADKFTLIRSIAHTFSDHGGGHKRFLTGRDPLEPTGFVNDYPMVGSMVAQVFRDRSRGVPNYIAEVDGGRQGIDVFSFGSAYLGPSTHPFMVVGDPNLPTFKVQNLTATAEAAGRMRERVGLLSGLDRGVSGVDPSQGQAIDTIKQRAFDLLTTDAASQAFDLSREPAALRERYGMHRFGQRCLLARRLVEAGATFVTTVLENPYTQIPKDGSYNWDSHAVNCHIFEDTRRRCDYLDQCITALIEDLYARGLDKKVLLIVTGEFGRTPRVSHSIGTQTKVTQPGRDHWPQAMSVLVSGGGMPTGQVVGSTTARGERPKDRPLTPNDLWATMFKHLGIDYTRTEFLDHRGRPMPMLPYGEPISELC